jgi:hypothetical protein
VSLPTAKTSDLFSVIALKYSGFWKKEQERVLGFLILKLKPATQLIPKLEETFVQPIIAY